MTCLAQHVGSDGDDGPDGRVDAEEEHPEHHASPHGQVGELQRVRGGGEGADRKCERREEIKPRGRRDGTIGHIVCMHHRPNIYTTPPFLPPPPGATSL